LLDDPLRLAALAAACALAEAALPEREPHRPLYDASRALLAALGENAPAWPAVYVRWELGLLAELGFGLDLSQCAATGAHQDLTHVSPRSGRAVSAVAAAPYGERLLPLPAFLAQGRGGPPANDMAADIEAGLTLTGFFLERHVFAPHRLAVPAARARFVERLAREGTKSGGISPS
jgi:DNA repair protein RecO (recombination protein O)